MSDPLESSLMSNIPLQSNVPEFSVSDLAFALKKTIEDNFGRVRVRGELSRVSIAGSGHMYSSLKDDNAVIDAVCWKGVMARLKVKPEEGLEVICTGRLSTYPSRSNYQLIIESMELAGQGALLKMLEDRKKKLAAEGLFDSERKKPLPFIPKTIGVVTSPTGAVIRDILHRVSDRFPRHVILWPALVQGQGAAEQVAEGIIGFNKLPEHIPRPDVLIVGRGGGSLEDLMPFNEEIVVRAVATSNIPIISAVGHETDTTLCDFAADLRAPTPTGAAEMAVPVRINLVTQVLDTEKRLINAINRTVTEYKNKTKALSTQMGDPKRLLEFHIQKLDYLGEKLSDTFKSFLQNKTNLATQTAARLKSPQDRMREAQRALDRWTEQLLATQKKLINEPLRKLEHTSKMLEAYSFENTLKRGFVVLQDKNNQLIVRKDDMPSKTPFNIRFANNIFVQATKIDDIKTPNQKKGKEKAKTSNQQGKLF